MSRGNLVAPETKSPSPKEATPLTVSGRSDLEPAADDAPSSKKETPQEKDVRVAVEGVLSNLGSLEANETPKQVRLIAVGVNHNKVALNFSGDIAAKGLAGFESAISKIAAAVHPLIQGEGINPKYPESELTVCIEGKTVSETFDNGG